MFKRLMKRAVSIVLVFAILCEIGTPLAYAAGESVEGTENAGAPEGAVYSQDTAAIINNSTKGEIVRASDDTVAFENVDRRESNTKPYRLTNGSDAVFLYPMQINYQRLKRMYQKRGLQELVKYYIKKLQITQNGSFAKLFSVI